MERDFEVEVVHRDRAVYRIRAADREEAEKLAADRWRTGDDSDVPGYDWSELISCVGQPAADAERSRQDADGKRDSGQERGDGEHKSGV